MSPSTVLGCDYVYLVLACINVVYNYEVVKSFPGTVTEVAHIRICFMWCIWKCGIIMYS